MNNYQLANIQLAQAKANSAVAYLNIACKNCEVKKCKKDCVVNQARTQIAESAKILSLPLNWSK